MNAITALERELLQRCAALRKWPHFCSHTLCSMLCDTVRSPAGCEMIRQSRCTVAGPTHADVPLRRWQTRAGVLFPTPMLLLSPFLRCRVGLPNFHRPPGRRYCRASTTELEFRVPERSLPPRAEWLCRGKNSRAEFAVRRAFRMVSERCSARRWQCPCAFRPHILRTDLRMERKVSPCRQGTENI